MQLYDAGIGDIITIPTHYPREVTVTGWRGGFGADAWIWGKMAGDLAQFTWTAPGWSGVTSMSEASAVGLVEKAGPDHPLRKAYEAELEAAMEALLAADSET